MKQISLATDHGTFKVKLLGERGDWVVCWPGQLNDFESMQDFAMLLARDFRVVLCDPPGVGINRALPYTRSVPALEYFALRVLNKFGISTCHWVGHSTGGVVGALLHVNHPYRIQSLTLASAPMLSEGRFQLHMPASTALLSSSRLGRHILASRGAKEIGFADAEEKKLVVQYLRKVLERTSPQTLNQMRPLDGAHVRRVFDKLRVNAPPLLILCGQHGRIVLPRDQRTVAEITQSQFVNLPCGHMNLLVEPEACAHAFTRFVATFVKQQPPAIDFALAA